MAYNDQGLLANFASTTEAATSLFYDRGAWVGSRFADGTWDAVEYTASRGPSRITDRLGRQIIFTRDRERRLSGLTGGNGHTTNFLYKSWNRPERIVYPNGDFESYAYDADGKLSRIDQGDASMQVSVNAAGRPLHLDCSDGTEKAYTWDDDGRLRTAKRKDATGEIASTFVYSDAGRPLEEETGAFRHVWIYDAAMRLTAQTAISGTDKATRSVAFAWTRTID